MNGGVSVPLVALVLPLRLAPHEGSPPQQALVWLEGLGGETREHSLQEEPLVDPRSKGAWLVRPRVVGTQATRGEGLRAQVTLAGGDRLNGRVRGGNGEVLYLDWVGGDGLSLDVSRIESLVFPERVAARAGTTLQPPSEGDRLYVLSSESLDEVDGTVEEFSAEGVRLDGVLGSKLFRWEEIAALYVEVFEDGVSAKSGPEVPVVVDLVDGSRMRAALTRLDPLGAELRLSGGMGVRIPLVQLVELAVDDGRLVFLSDLEAVQEEGAGSPFDDELGMRWPHKVDRSVLGDELLAGGQRYLRGIGTHAPTRVTWELDRDYQAMSGRVAIDDSSLLLSEWARGSVVFRVWGDDEMLWESRVLRGGDAPQSLLVPSLAGVRRLTLEVDPVGDFGGDRANWLRVRLVRAD